MAKTKKIKKLKKVTRVCFVIDRSGSMSNVVNESIAGINSQFQVLRDNIDKDNYTEVSLVQFDDRIDVVFDGVQPKELKEFGKGDFVPRGLTALFDGIFKGINLLKEKEEAENMGYLICVISDGAENASKEINQSALKAEIERLQNTGKWTFTYLMANIDYNYIYNNFGANINNVSIYNSINVGTATAYTANSTGLSGYVNMRSAGIQASKCFYASSDNSSLDKDLNDFDIDQIDKKGK